MPNNRSIAELVALVTSKTVEFQAVHQELVELRQELSNSVIEANKALEALNSTLNGSEAVSVAPVASSDPSTASEVSAPKPEPTTEQEAAPELEPEEKPKAKRGRPRKNATVEEPRTGEKRPVEEVDPKIDPVEPVTVAEENTEEVVAEETAEAPTDDVVVSADVNGNAVVEMEAEEEAEAEADAVEDAITGEDDTESPADDTPAEDDDTEDDGLTFDFDFGDDSEAAKPAQSSNDDEDFDNINVDEGAEGEQDVSSIDDIPF